MKKRTQLQMEFDLAAHGWAFCSEAMLNKRLPQLRDLAGHLDKHAYPVNAHKR